MFLQRRESKQKDFIQEKKIGFRSELRCFRDPIIENKHQTHGDLILSLHRFVVERGQNGGRGSHGVKMPRRPPRTSAVQMAHTFVHVFIAECTSDDQILPKNG